MSVGGGPKERVCKIRVQEAAPSEIGHRPDGIWLRWVVQSDGDMSSLGSRVADPQFVGAEAYPRTVCHPCNDHGIRKADEKLNCVLE